MSWLSAIKTGVSWLTGKSIGASLTRTVLLGYAVNKMSQSALKNNPTAAERPPEPDPGVKVQVNPDTRHKIPVLYGRSHIAGAITEAQMTADRKTMWYVVTLAEQTGTKLSDSQPSTYSFRDAYWNDARVVFKSDAVTVDYTVDREGNVDSSLSGLVEIYFYNEDTQLAPDNYTEQAEWVPARSRVPNWTANHTMNKLIFAVVKVTYDREKGVTGLGNMTFDIENSLSQAGDVLYDYMTARYGAGLSPEEIYSA
jgi:hypothetical protein